MATMKRSGGKIKNVEKICSHCGGVQKHITVVQKGKHRQCLECSCGIYNKSGQKVA